MITAEKRNFPVGLMCGWAGVSESGYWASLRAGQSATSKRREGLAVMIGEVWEASNRVYGYRKVHAALGHQGVVCSDRLVREIMAEKGWRSAHPGPWRCVTVQDRDATAPADLIGRDFTADAPGERTVGDITQIDTWEGPLYLATVIDLYSREVIGYAVDDNYAAGLVGAALLMAKRNGRLRRGAVFHSDRGSQYTSKEFAKCAKRCRARRSMGAVGSCFDNALAESFFASFKKELCDRTVFNSHEMARLCVVNYIEVFYNRQRLHQGLGYLTPAVVRDQYRKTGKIDKAA